MSFTTRGVAPLIALLLLSLKLGPAVPGSPPVAVEYKPSITKHLSRGVNLNGWFNEAGGASRFGANDLLNIQRWGFTFVRLPVDPEILDSTMVARLAIALDDVTTSGLAAIVDFHPSNATKQAALSDSSKMDWYLTRLRVGCALLKDRATDRFALELMNEPADPYRGQRPWDWDVVQHRLWDTARRCLPFHTLVLTGDVWSSLTGLLRLTPLPDSNVIYSVHFYQPYAFTHQGLVPEGPLRRIALPPMPYPADSSLIAKSVSQLNAGTFEPRIRDSLEGAFNAYREGQWNRSKLAPSFAQIALWSKNNHRVPLLDEFGVYRRLADSAARCRWLQDVRELAEADRIGWAMWEYKGGFGLFGDDGQPIYCVREALGLTSK